jgi:hypothetical protein
VEEVLEADRLAHEAAESRPPPPEQDTAGVAGGEIPITGDETLDNPGGGWVYDPPKGVVPPKPKVTRLPPPEKLDPQIRFEEATKQKDGQAEWGSGDGGYKSPTSPVEKMRCVVIPSLSYVWN